MKQLTPYLFFDGKCKDAMEFYKSCLGGKLTMTTVGESPNASQMPENTQNDIMHSVLTTDTMVLMASDMMDKENRVLGNVMAVCISGDDKDTIKDYFAKLSEGANVDTPLIDEFFGMFGSLTDKFGIRWIVQADKPKE